MKLSDIRFVCPRCAEPVARHTDGYICRRCRQVYHMRFGIPDFRLNSDRYLDLQQEIAKATRLANAATNRSFEELLDFYYQITDDVPPMLARRYKASILNGPRHMQPMACDVTRMLTGNREALTLDAGCGAGGMLMALAARGEQAVGVDIALRWLVLCQKRLREVGLTTPLVCADLARPPFSRESFDAVVAVDLVEHVPDIGQMLSSLSALAKPTALVWLTAANRFTLGPHPSTRVWALGWLPSPVRSWLLRKLRGIDSLRYTHLLSPGQLRRNATRAGLKVFSSRLRRIAMPDHRYSLFERMLMQVYRWVSESPLLGRLLVRIGPSFELVLSKDRIRERTSHAPVPPPSS
jgi:2-polyprenyl-3-methyl-5-hydroxy-6-metoxy-1,4-benzoquinol methylase